MYMLVNPIVLKLVFRSKIGFEVKLILSNSSRTIRSSERNKHHPRIVATAIVCTERVRTSTNVALVDGMALLRCLDQLFHELEIN